MEAVSKEKDSKKKRLIVIIIAAFLVCGIITGLLIFQSKYTALSIRLQRLVGVVNLYDKNGSERSLVEKMKLNSGNKITTATESLVTVSLDNTKLLTMEETSAAEVKKRGKKLKFELTEGNLFFNVTEKLDKKESFEIKTSTMAVGIRGTSAYVGMDFSHHETVMVTDGTVHVVAENPRTHEKIEVDVPAGMKIVIFLDDEAEGDATISFTMEPFKEEDLPAMALDTIHKNKKLRERVLKATGFREDKLERLYELNTTEGESMVGEAKEELSKLGLDDAIPFMGDKVRYMVEAANDAVVIAEEDLDLEVAIIKGLEDTSDVAVEGGLEKEEVVSVIHTTSGVIGNLIVQANENNLDDEAIIMVADNVSGAVTVAVKDMIVGDLSVDEIEGVVDTIGTVFGIAIDNGANEGPKAIIENVEDAYKFVKDTVNNEMNKNSNGEETSEALLRRDTGDKAVAKDSSENESEDKNSSSDNSSSVGIVTTPANNNPAVRTTVESSNNDNDSSNNENVNDSNNETAASDAGSAIGSETAESETTTSGSTTENTSSTNNATQSTTPSVYSVSLNPNGGRIVSNNVTSYTAGTGATLPGSNDVVKDSTEQYDYSFDGWYIDDNSNNKVSEISATDTGDKSFVARFVSTIREYVVSWFVSDDDRNNGTESDRGKVQYGSSPSAPSLIKNPSEYFTYTFNKWKAFFKQGDSYVESNTLYDSDSLPTIQSDTQFVATWTEVNRIYSVTLNTYGGTINSGNVTSYTYGTGATLPTAVTKTDDAQYSYSFDGWFTASSGGTQVSSIGNTETGDKEFHAQYTRIPVEYNVNISGLNSVTNGSVSVKNSKDEELTNVGGTGTAGYGTTVTVKAIPSSGFSLNTSTYSITVTGTSGTTVSATKVGDTYTFSMPAEAVTISLDTVSFGKPVTGVTLNKTAKTVEKDSSLNLIATITPADASDKSVTWSSSDDSIATVESVISQSGDISATVTAVSPGTATITVKTTDGNKTATCKITVPDPDIPTIDLTKLKVDRLGLADGAGKQITAKTFQRKTSADASVKVAENEVQLDSDTTKIYAWMDGNGNVYWYSIADYVYISNCTRMFYSVDYDSTQTEPLLTSINLTGIDTSKATGMGGMFSTCAKLTSLNLGNKFNTSNVTNMSSMFWGCNKLTSINLSSFDTSNVTTMKSMFNRCNSVTSLAVGDFDTSKVTDMSYMFYGVTSPTTLPVSGFVTDKVTNMKCMFYLCRKLTSLDLSGWNTSKVTDMSFMFAADDSVDVVNPISALESINMSGWNTSSVKDMRSMFNHCISLETLDLRSFDTSSVENMNYMFNMYGSSKSKLKTIYLGDGFNVSGIVGSGGGTSGAPQLVDMFQGCTKLETIYCNNSWDLSRFTNAAVGVFNNCTSLVGGRGTAYNSNNTHSRYAIVDGGAANPGYFTPYDGYGVGIDSVSNGTITLNSTSGYYNEGDSVALTVSPANNYELRYLNIKTVSGTVLTGVTFSGNNYYFVMPAERIVIKAGFVISTNIRTITNSDMIAESNWFDSPYTKVKISDSVTLSADLTIPAGKTLVIEPGYTFTIPVGVKLTVSGGIQNYGTIDNNGTIVNEKYINNYSPHTLNNYGIIINNGTFVNGDGGDNDGRLNNFDGAEIINNGVILNNEGSVINNEGDIDGNDIIGDGEINDDSIEKIVSDVSGNDMPASNASGISAEEEKTIPDPIIHESTISDSDVPKDPTAGPDE